MPGSDKYMYSLCTKILAVAMILRPHTDTTALTYITLCVEPCMHALQK
jgi:hypothetical protein